MYLYWSTTAQREQKAAYRSAERTNFHQHAHTHSHSSSKSSEMFADVFVHCLTSWCSGDFKRGWLENLCKNMKWMLWIFAFSHATSPKQHVRTSVHVWQYVVISYIVIYRCKTLKLKWTESFLKVNCNLTELWDNSTWWSNKAKWIHCSEFIFV